MFCPKCSKINPDSNEVCSNCGAELHEVKEVAPVKKNGILKAVVTVLVIAAVVAVVILLNGCDPGNIMQDNMTF